MLVTKQDILLTYDCANWFFKNRPDNPTKKAEEYKYGTYHLAIPFYTLPFDFTNRVLFNDKKSGVNGFTAMYEDTFILSFDASDSARDWETNFLYFQKTMPYAASARSPVRIHGGYVTGWMEVRDDILATFKASRAKKILVGGYSMGGGLAPIAALDIQYNFNIASENIHVVIGDGPRAFNKAGVHSYNKRVPNTIRIKWGNDAVTKVPPPLFGFRHVGQKLHLGPAEHWWKISLFNHDPGRGEYNSIMYQLPDGVVEPKWLSAR